MKKVMLLTNIISPYRIPLLNYISKRGDFNLKVVALSESEENREWKIKKDEMEFDYSILSGFHKYIWSRDLPIHLNPGIVRVLHQNNPDVIITSGYDAPAFWVAIIYSKFFKKKYVLWSGSTLLSSRITSGLVGKIKQFLIKSADRYIAYGKKSKEYLEYFGANSNKISIVTNSVDMEFFRKRTFEYRKKKTFAKEREKLPKFILLYVGQLIERKGVIQVLKTLKLLNDPEVGFFIVGDGPQRNILEKVCNEAGIENVYFEGFKDENALTRYYALANVLILPSTREVWGLVVNEALASGLYVLASKYSGASFDLIEEKWNGNIFDPENIENLVRLIKYAKDNVESIRVKREEISKEACERLSVSKRGDAFIKTLENL